MKIETSTCTKVRITNLIESEFRLDPITVFLEDIGPRQGKIIIECYGKSWSACWGGMGDRTITTFFCSCDQDYLAKNLSDISSSVFDGDALPTMAKQQIIDDRRGKEIDADEARKRYDDSDDLRCEHMHEIDRDLMGRIFGQYWFEIHLPEKPNHHYEYLCRIIRAVKVALRSIDKEAA